MLFVTEVPAIYFDGDNIWECSRLPSSDNHRFWAPDLWCLVDSKNQTDIVDFPVRKCSVLLAITPRKDCVSEFRKLPQAPEELYMPLWTQEELEAIPCLFPKAEGVGRYRFELWGGVPRLVLQRTHTDPEVLLISACTQCSLDNCIPLVSTHSEITSKTNVVRTLLHMHSISPYRTYELKYALETAGRIVARTKGISDRIALQRLLRSGADTSPAASLRGYVFESHSMDLLEKGGEFDCRELVGGRSPKKAKTKLTIPASVRPRQVVDRVEQGQPPNQLYVPKTPKYAAIDAWIPGIGEFQMTVGKTHTTNRAAEDDLPKLGPGSNCLLFLLPPEQFSSFTKKTPQIIKQYAVRIPHPEV